MWNNTPWTVTRVCWLTLALFIEWYPTSCKKEYHSKICLSFLSVWSQLYMDVTVQPIKVVEPNNFLMYMMHDATIESSIKTCGVVPLYMCSCIYLTVHTFFFIVHLDSLLVFRVIVFMPFLCIMLPKKKYTRVSSDELCILFKRFAMDVCHSLVLRVLTK